MDNLNEEAVQYLNSLSPADRDALYRQLKERGKGKPPVESLDSLTEELSELNKQPFQHREEKRKIRAEMDRKLKVNAQTQLALFINAEIEKTIKHGGAVDTAAIQKKGKSLDIHGDMAPHINEVMELRRVFRGGE